MTASDEDDSEFERFLQASLSSSSASNRSPRHSYNLSKRLSSLLEERDEEEKEEEGGETKGFQWLKSFSKDDISSNDRGIEKERRSLKLDVAVPLTKTSVKGEESEPATSYSSYSSDFSQDSIEGSTGSKQRSTLSQSGTSQVSESTLKKSHSSETESDNEEATPFLSSKPTSSSFHGNNHKHLLPAQRSNLKLNVVQDGDGEDPAISEINDVITSPIANASELPELEETVGDGEEEEEEEKDDSSRVTPLRQHVKPLTEGDDGSKSILSSTSSDLLKLQPSSQPHNINISTNHTTARTLSTIQERVESGGIGHLLPTLPSGTSSSIEHPDTTGDQASNEVNTHPTSSRTHSSIPHSTIPADRINPMNKPSSEENDSIRRIVSSSGEGGVGEGRVGGIRAISDSVPGTKLSTKEVGDGEEGGSDGGGEEDEEEEEVLIGGLALLRPPAITAPSPREADPSDEEVNVHLLMAEYGREESTVRIARELASEELVDGRKRCGVTGADVSEREGGGGAGGGEKEGGGGGGGSGESGGGEGEKEGGGGGGGGGSESGKEEDREWQKMVLDETEEGVDKEMYELQMALKSAGLPALSVTHHHHHHKSSSVVEETERHDVIHTQRDVPTHTKERRVQLSMKNDITNPVGEGGKLARRRDEIKKIDSSKSILGEEEKEKEEGEEGEEEEGEEEEEEGAVLKVLARQELSSIARKLLFEREQRNRNSSCSPARRVVAVMKEDQRKEKETRKSGLTGSKTGLKPQSRIPERKPALRQQQPGLRSGFIGPESDRPVVGLDAKFGYSCGGRGRRGGREAGGGRGGGGRGGGVRRSDGGGRGREIESLKMQIDSLKKSLSNEQRKTKALEEEMEKRETQYKDRQERLLKDFTNREKQLENRITQLNLIVQEVEVLPGQRRMRVGVARGEWEELQRSVSEQENIIRGYQKENERLYTQLNKAESSIKHSRHQMSMETQKLQIELANTKSKLEELQKIRQASSETSCTKSNDVIRITRLEDQLERSQDQCQELEKQVVQLKHSLHVSQLSAKTREKEGGGGGGERWEEELKEKEKMISELKEKLAAAQRKERLTTRKRDGGGMEEEEEEDKKKTIQLLEKQIRGLNDVIKRRYPNSLSALILAANPSSSSSSSGGHQLEMKRRLKELEMEFGKKEEKMVKEYKTLEERSLAMELKYLKELASLKKELEMRCQENEVKPPSTNRGAMQDKEEEEEEEGDWRVEEREKKKKEEEEGRRTRETDRARENEKTKKKTFELEKENKQLKQQLSSVELEATHQRLKLQTQLAEAEAAIRHIRDETTSEVLSLKRGHMTEVDSLKAQVARQLSHSETASLRSKLSATKMECHLLKKKLAMVEEERDELEESRERERKWTHQIKRLSEELIDAKRHHTPEMHHFSSLLAKISLMESRISSSEAMVRERVERMSEPTTTTTTQHIRDTERKWKRVVQAKDEEIAQFRSEIDTILETLHSLQTKPPSLLPVTVSSTSSSTNTHHSLVH